MAVEDVKVATTRVDQRPFAEILKESGFTKKVDGPRGTKQVIGSFNAFERFLKKIYPNLTVFSNDSKMMNRVTKELNKVRKSKELLPYTNVGKKTSRGIFENIYSKSKGFEGEYAEQFSKADKDKFTKIQLDVQKKADKKFGLKETLNKTELNKKLTYMANQIKEKIGNKTALRLGLTIPVIKVFLTKSLYGTPLAPIAAASDAAMIAETLSPVAEEAKEKISEKVIEPAAKKMVEGENILQQFFKTKMNLGGMMDINEMTRPVSMRNGGDPVQERKDLMLKAMTRKEGERRADMNTGNPEMERMSTYGEMPQSDLIKIALQIAGQQGDTSEENVRKIVMQLSQTLPSLQQDMANERTSPISSGLASLMDMLGLNRKTNLDRDVSAARTK